MALVLLDRAKETTTVVGTGTATLLGAVTSYQSLAGVGNGNTTYYCIVDQVGANWEVGIGTYTASGTTLARTTVLASSNAGALVVFTTGVKDVFVTYPSEKGVWYDASGNVLFTGTTTAANLAYTGTLTGSTGILNIGSGQIYKDAGGNVGIGTSSPTVKLDVNISGATNTMRIGDYTAAAASTLPIVESFGNRQDSNSTFFGRFGASKRRSDGTAIIAGQAIGLYAFGAQWGTDTSYQSTKHLYSASISGVSESSFTSATTMSTGIAFYTGSAGAALSAFNTGYGTERMRIDSAGNVGIGTSSPACKLNVVSGTNNGIQVYDGTVNTLIYNTGSNTSVIGTNTNHPLALYTNNTERMRIDSAGNVGIGTSSPSSYGRLAVMTPTATYGYFGIANSSGGGGGLQMAQYYGTTKISYIDSILSNGTPGSETAGLAFATASVGTLSEKMRIDSSGRLYINQSGQLGNTLQRVGIQYAASTEWGLNITNSTTSTGNAVNFTNSSGTQVGQIQCSTSVTSYVTSSDQRLKANIVDAPSALDSVNAIKVRSFDWKSDSSHVDYGYIAQELLEVAPEAVAVPTNKDEMMGVDFGKLTPRLVKAIQELKAIIDTQQEQINSLLGK